MVGKYVRRSPDTTQSTHEHVFVYMFVLIFTSKYNERNGVRPAPDTKTNIDGVSGG